MLIPSCAAEIYEQVKKLGVSSKTAEDGISEKELEEYLPLVRYIVGRVSIHLPPHIEKEDLEHEGIIGLLDAFHRHDKNNGKNFKAYASARIHGRIMDWLRSQDWAPRSIRKKARKIEDAYAGLEQSLGRTPADNEVAGKLGIKPEQFHKDLREISCASILSLEDMLHIPESNKLHSNNNDRPDKLKDEIIIRALSDSIQKLPEKEMLVLSLYYQEELVLREIAEVLEISESTVCRIHTKAILKLKRELAKILGLMDTMRW